MRRLFTGLIATVIMFVVGGFVADNLLRENLGLSLAEVINYFLSSSETLENARSITNLGNVSSEVSGLISEKDSMEEALGSLDDFVSSFNNNTDLTEGFKEALGDHYSIYLFTVTTIMNESFKVFEWSIEFTDGLITTFDSGMSFTNYSVIVQMDQSIASALINNSLEMDAETITPMIKNGLVKVKPLTELMRVATLLPQVFSRITSYE